MQGERLASRFRLGLAAALMVVLCESGCATHQDGFKFRGTTAASMMNQIADSKDPNIRYAAYDHLGSARFYDNDEQRAKAARMMVEKLKENREPVATRAVICRSLGTLRRPEAREAILIAVHDEDPLVRAEACRTLGFVGRSEDATVLAQIMASDTTGECRIAAIESIGELKAKDRRIVEFLVAGMEHDDPAIRVASLKALRSITGQDRGVDAIAWKKYVETLYPPSSPTQPDPVVDPIAASSRPDPTLTPTPRPNPGDLDPILPR